MVNREFEPTANQEAVLDVFKADRGSDAPWGYANPMRIRLETDLKKQRVNDALKSLTAAGWIKQVQVNGQSVRGLYKFSADPRETE